MEEGVEDIVKIAKEQSFEVFQGNLNDVLDRFYQAAFPFQTDYVVRVTSDCPLLDANLIDEVIALTIKENADYGANILAEHFPDGQDVEVFSFQALKRAWEDAKLPSEREHVTPYIRNNSDVKGGALFHAINYEAPANFNHIRMTVDEPKDLLAIETLVNKLGKYQTWEAYTQYIIHHICDFNNQDIVRNEGYLKSIKNDNQ
jgi:spore coat polysaccharide biosynthesis protein SpsF (cytidylyltransferase family)